jgi:uncharacterized UPF0160 family protein
LHTPSPEGSFWQESSMRKIITHDGVFHADEVMATAMLKLSIYVEEVIRTRDEEIINRAKSDEDYIVLDVGGEFDPILDNYDHHQRNFTLSHHETNILFSTAGLIWNEYGYVLIHAIIPNANDYHQDLIYNKMYKDIISVLDAHDNGDFKTRDEILANNRNAINIANIISMFNPAWEDNDDTATEAHKQKEDKAFEEAVDVCMTIIKKYIEKAYGDLQAEEYVKKQFEKTNMYDEILILDKFAPWKKALVEENKVLGENGYRFRVVIYPNKTNKQYIAEAVKNPDGTDKFLFPKNLRGQPKELLTFLTGYESIEFVHRTGFLAVFNDKQELIEFVDNLF